MEKHATKVNGKKVKRELGRERLRELHTTRVTEQSSDKREKRIIREK